MNAKLLYESDRLFSIYGYTMSHGLLLLRSGKSNKTPTTRVDILFRDVRVLEIRAWFEGIKIEEVDDPQFLNSHPSKPLEMFEHGIKLYSLTSSTWKGFVVAGTFSMAEDNGELMGPSPLVAEPPDAKRWALVG